MIENLTFGNFNSDYNTSVNISMDNLPIGNASRYIEAKILLESNNTGGIVFSYGTPYTGTPIYYLDVSRTYIATEFGSGYCRTVYTLENPLQSNVIYKIGISYGNGVC